MKLSVKFNLENNKLPYEYRRTMISFFKHIFSEYQNGEYKDIFYNDKKSIRKDFAYSFYLPGAKFLEDRIELKKNFFKLNISTDNYKTFLLLHNAILKQKGKPYPLPFGNNMRAEVPKILKDREIIESEIKIRMLSPLCVRRHNKESNKDIYLTYIDENFIEALKDSIKYQTRDSHIITDELIDNLEISYNEKEVKRTSVAHYGIKIPVTIGCLYLKGNPVLLNYLYKFGIGSRVSSGFGHFEVV